MNERTDKVLYAMLCTTRQCWEEGVAAQALYECDEKDALKLFVYDMVLRQSSDGRLCNVENTPAVTDSAFCIPAVHFVAAEEQNENYGEAARKNIAFLCKEAERTQDGILYHIRGEKNIWADSAAYLPYALALLGEEEEAVLQMRGICERLFDKNKGFYYHMWNEERQEYARKEGWAVGNGWILTGLLRTGLVLRERGHEAAEEFFGKFRELLDKMLSYLDEEHMLHDIIDDYGSFQETTSSEMVAYSIYRAIKEEIIALDYLESADRIRKAVYGKVTEEGLVMDSCSSPAFNKAGTSVECQAHFLMMEAAYDKIEGR